MHSLREPEPSSVPSAPKGGLWRLSARLPGGLEISFAQVLLVAGIVFYALATPGTFLYKLDALGFGVCHQIPSHSYFVDGHQLPLCARCTGIYLGVSASLVLLVLLRGRASRLPATHMLAILGVFFSAMVVDGVNSTLETFSSNIYPATNLLRILTGSLSGITVAFMFYPMFNLSIWRPRVATQESVLERPFELVAYMVATGLLVALVLDRGDWLFYPIAVVSLAGVLSMLTMANTMILLIATRREATFGTFSEALTPLLIGLFMSLVELTLLAWGRASLAPFLVNNLGMPLVPGLP